MRKLIDSRMPFVNPIRDVKGKLVIQDLQQFNRVLKNNIILLQESQLRRWYNLFALLVSHGPFLNGSGFGERSKYTQAVDINKKTEVHILTGYRLLLI